MIGKLIVGKTYFFFNFVKKPERNPTKEDISTLFLQTGSNSQEVNRFNIPLFLTSTSHG